MKITRFVTIDEKNQYFEMIRNTWGQQLKRVFESIDDPVWDAAPDVTSNVLSATNMHSKPVRLAPPSHLVRPLEQSEPLQALAERPDHNRQF